MHWINKFTKPKNQCLDSRQVKYLLILKCITVYLWNYLIFAQNTVLLQQYRCIVSVNTQLTPVAEAQNLEATVFHFSIAVLTI